AACGGGGGSDPTAVGSPPPAPPPAPTPPPPAGLSAIDASRFLTQATFGLRSTDEVAALQAQGLEDWLVQQFAAPAASQVSFLDEWRTRKNRNKVADEASYEAVWQQWLWGADPLRSRIVWSLLQVFVISNVAPDVRPYAMSSYMDMLGRNAFGNYRQLLEEVALHPAMGYYLNMLESGKENAAKGTHPSENFAREVLQLFSIGLVKLHLDGSTQTAGGVPVPTYDQSVVKGFAKAFTGWSFGNQDNTNPKKFDTNNGENTDANWLVPMKAWPSHHDSTAKTLLDGRVLPAGQTAEQDLKDALDTIFNHANVGPFFCRQMIQRLVTSNPSPAYLQRVAGVFNDNGAGVRGDLQAVWRAILLDTEARGDDAPGRAGYGKQREPVVRFANFLRALGAASASGYNEIDYLDSADNALGQSPLLAPSVFNFYSPNYRPAGALAAAGLVAPEFQITSETTVAGAMNFFSALFDAGSYGNGASKVTLDYGPLVALAATPAALVARLDELFFNRQMGDGTRGRLTTLLAAMSRSTARERVTAALKITAMSTDFVIQK
ncbi:MAG TPA: DUF1800 family protein, partial [Ideonella sp.]|nr:DUF1800 family protein [Ideonella sp.]